MSRIYRQVVDLGIRVCVLMLGAMPSAHSAGLLSAMERAADISPPYQWPVLRNAAREPAGLYGGIVSAYSRAGAVESATLLILPTGYVMPVLRSGETATFPVAYFEQDDCKGREYLATSGAPGALLPARGMVYRSPVDDALNYIPKDADAQSLQMRSRWVLGGDAGQCAAAVEVRSAFAAHANEATVTGVDAVVGTGPLALTIESAAGARKRPERTAASLESTRGSADDAAQDAPASEVKPECSPGCLMEAVGNGVCDIMCYYPACDHDGGDCAAMKPEDLEREMAQMCAPGCKRADIGDGFCDSACQTDACQQDGGDCDQKASDGE